MYNLLARKGQLFAIVLGLILIAIFLIPAISGLNSGGFGLGEIDLKVLSADDRSKVFGYFSPGITTTTYLVIFTAFLTFVVFGIINLIKFPKAGIRSIIAFAVLCIVFVILYKTSDAETTGKIGRLTQKYDISENTSKMISGGLKTTMGLAALAGIIMIVSEIRNLFK